MKLGSAVVQKWKVQNRCPAEQKLRLLTRARGGNRTATRPPQVLLSSMSGCRHRIQVAIAFSGALPRGRFAANRLLLPLWPSGI